MRSTASAKATTTERKKMGCTRGNQQNDFRSGRDEEERTINKMNHAASGYSIWHARLRRFFSLLCILSLKQRLVPSFRRLVSTFKSLSSWNIDFCVSLFYNTFMFHYILYNLSLFLHLHTIPILKCLILSYN